MVHLVLEMFQVHLLFKDMLVVLQFKLALGELEEAEVLPKLVIMLLLLKAEMVEMELHLLYQVLQ